jgi:hypothetical protein
MTTTTMTASTRVKPVRLSARPAMPRTIPHAHRIGKPPRMPPPTTLGGKVNPVPRFLRDATVAKRSIDVRPEHALALKPIRGS